MVGEFDKILECVFPWYKDTSGHTEYTVQKFATGWGTDVAAVSKDKRIRYLLRVFGGCGVCFTPYFPSIDFNCDGMPFIVHEAQRNIRVKDSSPESLVDVKRMADYEDLYRDVEQGVVKRVDSVYSNVPKGVPVGVAVQVVNCSLGEFK
jgi:hypothetical protein